LERSGEEEIIAEFQPIVTEVSTSNDPAAKNKLDLQIGITGERTG
jgi:predicted component of type VI protein secretion system